MHVKYESIEYKVTWKEDCCRFIKSETLHTEDQVIKFCRELSGQGHVIPESIKCLQTRRVMLFNERNEQAI